MKLSIAHDDGTALRVELTGKVTQRDLADHRDPLFDLLGPDGYQRQVRLDLSEASYLDSSGVSWLLHCHRRMKEAGGNLSLVCPHPAVAMVLKVLKLERVFEIDGKPPVASMNSS